MTERSKQTGLRFAGLAGMLMMLSLMSKVLGFFREVLLARAFGATSQVDAYVVASVIPVMVFGLVEIGIKTGFVPVYTRWRNQSEEQARKFAGAVLMGLALIGVGATFVVGIFAPAIVTALAPGFDQKTQMLATLLVRISAAAIFLRSFSIGYQSLFNANDRFLLPAVSSLLPNVCIILAVLVLGDRVRIEWVMVATAFGMCLNAFTLLVNTLALDRKIRPQLALCHQGVAELGAMALPVVLGMMASDVNTIIDRIMASTLPGGRIAALNYASRVTNLFETMFIASIATIILPSLSQHYIDGDREKFDGLLGNSTIGALMLSLPLSVLMLCMRVPIVRVLFERGAFDATASALTAGALAYYGLGMVPRALTPITLRGFYAMGNSRTPMIISILSVVMNVILNLLLIGPMGHLGLALATSVALTIRFVLSVVLLRRKGLHPLGRGNLTRIAWIVSGSVWVAFCATMLTPVAIASPSKVVVLLRSVLVGTLAVGGYIAVLLVSGVLRVSQIMGYIRRRG